ncbi:hypothetical protein WICPIJ_001059 [Wickerhamomyces pijperi]|uniref:DNA mismatch repair proteins mutS family domain-containing protein n=1 Tax=Wickerhamomyces pijperi TaxID=599730 RepID=A0A9P8QEL5_WICPI|nr:hypothetical protein WICPIJ_001059 [Wickerhamomyces pijperi]
MSMVRSNLLALTRSKVVSITRHNGSINFPFFIHFPTPTALLKTIRHASSSNKTPREPTKITLSLSKMGPLKPSNTSNQDTLSPRVVLTPLMKYVRETMDMYPEYVTLTQVGSFYELYFEQATKYAPLLNMQLTSKKFKDGVKIPFTGFPMGALPRYLRLLVGELGQGVVIVDQELSGDGLGEVRRRISRIISPGTLIDEEFMDSQANNYLLSLEIPSKLFERAVLDMDAAIGLAWVDLSVGLVKVQEVKLNELVSAINRVKPVEIIANEEFPVEQREKWDELNTIREKFFWRVDESVNSKHQMISNYFHMFPRHELVQLDTHFKSLAQKELAALRSLLNYVQDHLPGSPIQFTALPEKEHSSEIMEIDPRTSEALELLKTYKHQYVKGSLISTIRRTVTDAGSRLLNQWISGPSTNLQEIQRRQDMVGVFYDDHLFNQSMRKTLGKVHDISRIVQRFSLGRGTPLDLIMLARAIEKVDEVKELLVERMKDDRSTKKVLKPVVELLVSQRDLSLEILRDLDEDALMKVIQQEKDLIAKETKITTATDLNSTAVTENEPVQIIDFGAIVTSNASPSLSILHEEINALLSEKFKLSDRLHESLVSTGSLKEASLKFAPNLMYQVYFRGTKTSNFDMIQHHFPEISFTQQNQTTRWATLPEWTKLGSKIDALKYRIQREEQEIIKLLRRKVIEHSIQLRQISKVIDEIDVTSSLAILAKEKNLIKPILDSSTELEIRGGRHLVVESHLSQTTLRKFTPNDTIMSQESASLSNIHIITGPNMGGKSTYLRQVALIVLLSHIGSYVPANYAKIGITDKILTRVGSADDLSSGQSTFMVEMLETGYILRKFGERSLAILDEVGRGTGVPEGIAVAFATIEGLRNRKGRCLFATHFGVEIKELMDEEQLSSVCFKKTGLRVLEDKVIFEHRLKDGVSLNSGALDVAKLAGFPSDSLLVAQRTLKRIENSSLKK